MKKTRHQIVQELACLPGYWAKRCTSELRYLEELFTAGVISNEAFLDMEAESIYTVYLEEGSLGKSSVLLWEQQVPEEVKKASKSFTVSCVGHAHMDMNWQWTYDETVMVVLDTIRTMLNLMEKYPDMVYLQSQAAVYHIIERYAPEMLEEIRDAIQRGQWEVVASTWVEADKNLPNGESAVRQLMYTKKYLSVLLGLSDEDFLIDFEPDTFGHASMTPEILEQGGVKYLYHCRGEETLSLYHWKAASGKKITVLREPMWYNAPIEWESFLYIPGYCTAHKIDTMCHVFGTGDHGGGVTRRDIERIHDMNEWPCMPVIRFGKLWDFFKETDNMELPLVSGERNFVFDGCYSSQSRIKAGNRQAERELYEAELLSSMASLICKKKYNERLYEDAWRAVLFNQFHDILPGSCTGEARDFALGRYQEVKAYTASQKSAAIRAVMSCVNTAASIIDCEKDVKSISEGAGAGYHENARYHVFNHGNGGSVRVFHLVNTFDTVWEGNTELTVWDWPYEPSCAKVTDENGVVMQSEIIDGIQREYWTHRYFRILLSCRIPAFGYRTVYVRAASAPVSYERISFPRKQAEDQTIVLENDLVRAAFDVDGLRIRTFEDKRSLKNMIPHGATGGFDFTEEDSSKGMTAWIVGRQISSRSAIEHVSVFNEQKSKLRCSFSFKGKIRESDIDGLIWLDSGSRMLHISVNCRWKEIGNPGGPVPKLSFGIPVEKTEKIICDTPYLIEARETGDHDIPAQTFVYASGLMLTTDSKYGFGCNGQKLSVTLLRSSYDPDPLPEFCDHHFTIGLGIPENEGNEALMRESRLFLDSPIIAAGTLHEGKLPQTGAWMEICGNVHASAIKTAEDGTGDLIVRIVNYADSAETFAVSLPEPISRAFISDIHEKCINRLEVDEKKRIHAKVEPHALMTLRIEIS